MKLKNLKIALATSLLGGFWLSFASAQENLIRDGNFDGEGPFKAAHAVWEIAYREPDLGIVTFETDEAPEGAGFLRLAPLNSAPPKYLAVQHKLDPPPLAGRYKLKAWMRISSEYAARMPIVSVGWQNPGASGETGSAHISLDQGAQPDEWTLCETEFEIPKNAEGTYVFLFTYGSMGHADFDGIALERIGE